MHRILVHDWAGYPYPVEVSRELARRGHTVRHLHFMGMQGQGCCHAFGE